MPDYYAQARACFEDITRFTANILNMLDNGAINEVVLQQEGIREFVDARTTLLLAYQDVIGSEYERLTSVIERACAMSAQLVVVLDEINAAYLPFEEESAQCADLSFGYGPTCRCADGVCALRESENSYAKVALTEGDEPLERDEP